MGGLFSALRYLRRADRGPRRLGPDGRPLRRPLGVRSATVRDAASRRRSSRPQPIWPRVVGVGFVGIAVVAAATAEYPVPRPSRAGLSAPRAAPLLAIEAVGPRGPQAKVPGAFVWRTDAPPPYTVVVADGAYRELFRLEGVEACAATPPEALRAALAAGGAFSWQVFARAGGRAVVSPTEAFEIR